MDRISMRGVQDIPTKRRSGAHAIMSQACRDTAAELERVLMDASRSAGHAEARALLDEISTLAGLIEGCGATVATNPETQRRIQRIIDIGDRTRELAGTVELIGARDEPPSSSKR